MLEPAATPQNAPEAQTIVIPESLTPVTTVVMIVVTILMLGVTVFAIVRLPRATVRTTKVMAERTAHAITPVIAHHKPIPKVQEKKLDQKITAYLRLASIAVPFVLVYFAPVPEEFSFSLSLTLAGGLAAAALLALILSWLVSRTTSQTQSHASRG